MKLEGKKAVITGAGSGIGKAIAFRFAEEGADVAVFDTNREKSEKVAETIRSLGRDSRAIRCDVGFSKEVNAAMEKVVKAFGSVDIMICNAGIIRQNAVVDMPEEEWDLVIRNNLKSVFLCAQAGARQMIKQGGGGRIIAISSIHAVLSEPNCGHYTASKGGIEAFCRTLATELATHRITVNFIRPGATYTELTIPLYTDSVVKSLRERVPLKEIAQAGWIAAGALFLASEDAGYMTGQDLTIDGGYLMDGSLPGAAYWVE